jgi:hypothetical protein
MNHAQLAQIGLQGYERNFTVFSFAFVLSMSIPSASRKDLAEGSWPDTLQTMESQEEMNQ